MGSLVPPPSRSYERAALAAGDVTVDAEGRVHRVRRYGRPCAPYLAARPNLDGYLVVPLALAGRRVRLLAHRLVYEARIGPIPEGHLVRQRNGDRADNRPENLVVVPGKVPRRGAVGPGNKETDST
jgi:hypothetical protein